MALLTRTTSSLNIQSLSALQQTTRLTQVAQGTVLQGITAAVNTVLGQSYTDLTSSLAQVYLSTASGQSLDFIGQMLGLPRGGSTQATSANAQRFYVLTGNFGSLPGIGALNNIIPGGTIVQTSDSSIQYQTVGNITFSNTDTQVLATIRALNPGAASNVGVNVLTQHNLAVANLLTTNISAISSGDDTETDGDYRYRLSLAVTAAEAANEISIRLAALSVPGVSDVIIIPYYYGVGTYTIIVIGTTPVIDQTVLNSVLQIVQQVTALGEFVSVQAPRYIGIEIKAKLIFNQQTLDTDKAPLANAVIDNIYNYINNLPIGTGLIRDQIVATILNTSTNIQDVINDPTDPNDMDIAVWTPTTIDIVNNVVTINRVRQDIGQQNYTALFDDKLIVEQNLQGFVHAAGFTPITVTWE